MQSIDRNRLYTDLVYRFQYVAGFVDFGEEDQKLIKESAGYLAPLVPVVVDAVYNKLFKYDITKSSFSKPMEGQEGNAESTNAKDLSMNSENIKFRKGMLSNYLVKLVTCDFDEKLLKYLDRVALIHLPSEIKKSPINIEFIHINALMGYVESVLLNALCDYPVDEIKKRKTMLAFNKVLWIQNDLFAQYYVRDGNELPDALANIKKIKKTCTCKCNGTNGCN